MYDCNPAYQMTKKPHDDAHIPQEYTWAYEKHTSHLLCENAMQLLHVIVHNHGSNFLNLKSILGDTFWDESNCNFILKYVDIIYKSAGGLWGIFFCK